jgi:hypothetical protein
MSGGQPEIKVPIGMSLVQMSDGSYEVVANHEPMSKTVAFRLPASTYNDVLAFVESFPDKGWGSAMRWLLSEPDVRAKIATKIAESTRRRR